jgi:hypothetical protein
MTILTELRIRAAKAGEKPYKLFDERGLFMLVTSAGGRLWRFKYHLDGVEKLLTLGSYPDVSLKHARSATTLAALSQTVSTPVQNVAQSGTR